MADLPHALDQCVERLKCYRRTVEQVGEQYSGMAADLSPSRMPGRPGWASLREVDELAPHRDVGGEHPLKMPG